MTRREYASLAGVHPDTVKRWARLGIGPRPRKIGPRLVRYNPTEVCKYLGIGESRECAS
ncbi:helix-turn-helix transcriptional regulator [Streptomyces liliifuscus]|uniref:DNA-binding protein n=1 Tax=Streptomyces liliifuscus TaxID=2797636 RepID=A0A7T7I6U3_9ACTN|nr:DNA-binding protein [Streptomyces liliifuscus]QQM41996.1 DNA-binding protein [Streptomyces liliifuscus]